MPKIKTHKSAAKRFSVTGTGKITHHKAGKRHLLTHKSTKRKRNLRDVDMLSHADRERVHQMMPYMPR
ncbi:MAG: 50S ribosomal protein L35 [Magnetococcales bacterium]|nr:50S ribosomal protein L35 [Magnetococcales bacterium]